MNYNNLFITDEQMTNNIEVTTSFLSIFPYIIKELLTKSNMATNNMDGQGQQDRPYRGKYMPPLERARNLIIDLTGRGRVLRPSSPPHVGRGLGRGLLAFTRGKRGGLRPSSLLE